MAREETYEMNILSQPDEEGFLEDIELRLHTLEQAADTLDALLRDYPPSMLETEDMSALFVVMADSVHRTRDLMNDRIQALMTGNEKRKAG